MPARGHQKPSSLKDAVGQRIRAVRSAKGLSQGELARRTGTGRSAVSSMEKGRNLTLSTIESIAEALHVDPASLLSRASRPPRASPESRVLVRIVELLREQPDDVLRSVELVARTIVRALAEGADRRGPVRRRPAHRGRSDG